MCTQVCLLATVIELRLITMHEKGGNCFAIHAKLISVMSRAIISTAVGNSVKRATLADENDHSTNGVTFFNLVALDV